MDIILEKEILIQWIKAINDPETISKIKHIRKEEDFDFEKEWDNIDKKNKGKKLEK